MQVSAGERHPAGERPLQAGQGAQQGGLAGAIGPDQADQLARRQRKVGVRHQRQRRAAPPTVADGQSPGTQQAHDAKTRRRLRRRKST
ncbi:MAG: hypothetical protein OXH77_00020 [Anaerolineaceae bacterium]|nr:hypothetical protein [Anaerolineaceae bacterium]